MRLPKKIGALLALFAATTLFFTGCGNITSVDSRRMIAEAIDCSAVPTSFANAEKALAEAEAGLSKEKAGTPGEYRAKQIVEEMKKQVAALEKRNDECKASNPQSTKQENSTQSPSGTGQSAEVTQQNEKGEEQRAIVPMVTNLGNNEATADTVGAGAQASMLKREEILQGWDSLVNLVDKTGATWYIDEMNSRKSKTNFDWSDVKKWATARNAKGQLVESRVIEVFGHDISDKEARRRAAEVVGGQEVAEKLFIVRHPRAFMNTWTSDGKSLLDYLFNPTEAHAVRVSLAPLQLNEKGQVIGLYAKSSSGVFVDCYNIWWRPLAIKTNIEKPPVVPPSTPGGGTPPSKPPVVQPKTVSVEPAPRGNSGNGRGKNTNSGPDALIPPQNMEQSGSRWSSPAPPRVAPAPQPAPVPEIPPAPAPPPEQGAPTPDNPATGCVPAPGEDDC